MNRDYLAIPRSKRNIRQKALEFRTALGLENCRSTPVLAILEHSLPDIIDGFNYEIVAEADMPGREAETYPATATIAVRQDTYSAARRGNRHALFTICHEFGHLLLHGPGSISLAYEREDLESPKIYESPEWQANEFAAEFLAPVNLIKGMDVTEIEAHFPVSHAVAIRQYEKAFSINCFGHCRHGEQQYLPGLEPVSGAFQRFRTPLL